MTALHYAANRGFKEIVKFLILYGSNVDLQNNVLIFFFILFVYSLSFYLLIAFFFC